MDSDQASQEEDSGGSWWNSVTNAASSVANAVTGSGGEAGGGSSAWDTAEEVVKKIPTGLDIAEKAGSTVAKQAAEAIPAIGAIPSVWSGAEDSDKASDARRDAMLNPDDKARVATDNDKDAFYQGREDYDLLGAIPLVGTAMDIGEVAVGAYNAATGGEGGYKEGAESFKDMAGDGIDAASNAASAAWNWVTGGDGSYKESPITGGASHTPVGTTGLGSRLDLRHRYEQEAEAQGMEP